MISPFSGIADAIRMQKKYSHFKRNYKFMSEDLYADHLTKISTYFAKVSLLWISVLFFLTLIALLPGEFTTSQNGLPIIVIISLIMIFSLNLKTRAISIALKYLEKKYPSSHNGKNT